jgi:hypothetical protein
MDRRAKIAKRAWIRAQRGICSDKRCALEVDACLISNQLLFKKSIQVDTKLMLGEWCSSKITDDRPALQCASRVEMSYECRHRDWKFSFALGFEIYRD